MTTEMVSKLIAVSKNKVKILNESCSKYFLLSIMAGIYVGFGIMLIFSIGAPLKMANDPMLKALMGASFALALTLVVFAGSELFTGNNMTMTIGSLSKEVSWTDTLKIWIISYAGNLVGSLLMAWTLVQTGLVDASPLKEFVLGVGAAKMNAPFMQLFFRGILCNMLVCLAIWMATNAKEDIAKLVLIFWCLFGFIGSGFEHSIANMTLLGMAVLIPHDPATISWSGYLHNLIPVTLGNMVGGSVMIGGVYYYIAHKNKK